MELKIFVSEECVYIPVYGRNSHLVVSTKAVDNRSKHNAGPYVEFSDQIMAGINCGRTKIGALNSLRFMSLL